MEVNFIMLVNNDKCLISDEKVYAPQIAKDTLVDYIIEYFHTETEDTYTHTFDEMRDALLSNTGDLTLKEGFLSSLDDDEIDCSDDNIISMSTEIRNNNFDNILGIHILNNGIPFWGVLLNGSYEIEMFKAIYYDGKHLRFYTPFYGNTVNFLEGKALSNDADDGDDDDFYDKYGTDAKTVVNARLEELIDEVAILEELNAVFEVGNNPTRLNRTGSGNVSYNSNSSSSTCSGPNFFSGTHSGNSSNSGSSSPATPPPAPQKSPMDIICEVFSKKMYALIPGLQQSLIQQGIQTYDKSKCFKDLKNKDTFQKDIYNYILQFDNNQSDNVKCIECTKIVTYMKKYKYYHEGGM